MAAFEFLGPYRIGREIGRGGMGTVYEAVHETSQERVAVKLISASIAEEMKFRRRFAGEVETLKRLRHPNIVRLIGYGEEDGHLFYSMELVDGESLQQQIRRLKRIDWLPTLEVAIQVCGALKHAHDLGVIHRDLKPANLLITADGAVKLVDFGIAKLFGSGEQTVAGSMLGTADYMAPEQADSGAITPRTDLYALGSVMYAMLTGRPPFSGKRLTEVIDSLKRDRPVPLDLVSPDLPEEVVSIVHDLLEKEPRDRPPTALALLNRLKATQAGLQRSQTIQMDASKTVLGDDAEDLQNRSTADRPAEEDRRFGTRHSGEDATDGGGAVTHVSLPIPERERTPLKTGHPDAKRASPDDATLVSENTFRTPQPVGEASELPTPPRSHYQTVDPSQRPKSAFDTDHEEHRFGWVQTLSVTGMIAVLIAGIAVIAYAFKTPSADQLYQQIESAERSGELSSVEPTIRRFLNDYPNDERSAHVETLNEAISLERSLRQLQAKANRAGGNEQLDPIEQAFLDAMDFRARDPVQARRKLAAWLAVYAPGGETDSSEARRMTTMVEQELAKLQGATRLQGPDPRAKQLFDRIAWGREHLPPAERRRMFEGMIELFSEQPWAQSAMAQVQAELNAIERQQTDD